VGRESERIKLHSPRAEAQEIWWMVCFFREGVAAMSQSIVEQVQSKYASVAASTLSSDHAGVRAIAEAFGYSPEELAAIPAEANMGLSCGNPTAFARLRPGETVVDLGCGGGLDVLLAAPKVGPTGRAIGIDMTPEMIERARQNAAKQGLRNVEFHLATIDHLPLPDNSVDCLISNCVINLAPDKRAVFREMFRVLKPGGRVAVSDIALKKSLPYELAQSVMAYTGCVAGALLMVDYEQGLREAGFESVQIVDTRKDLNAYAQLENQSGCCSPAMISTDPLPVLDSCCSSPAENAQSSSVHQGLAELLSRFNVNDYAASVQVYALKAR
jgi:SAM-dependent methyltransferase